MESVIDPILISSVVLVITVLLEKALPIPDKVHPLTLIKQFAIMLGRKVNPDSSRSVSQQHISGTLALIIVLLPAYVCLALFFWFAEYAWFFEGVLLYFGLHFQPVINNARKIQHSLKKKKKALARQQLKPLVLRETQALTEMGVIKTNIECLALRYNYQYVTTIFCFLLGGGALAFSYRLLFEMSQTWNIKQSDYQHFGKPAAWICILLQWLPVRLSSFIFSLALNFLGGLKALKAIKGPASSHTFILAMFAGSLKTELGGPAFYNGKKIRLPKIGGGSPPTLTHISACISGLNWATTIFLVLYLSATVSAWALKSSGI